MPANDGRLSGRNARIAGAQQHEKFAQVIDAELARGERQPKAPAK